MYTKNAINKYVADSRSRGNRGAFVTTLQDLKCGESFSLRGIDDHAVKARRVIICNQAKAMGRTLKTEVTHNRLGNTILTITSVKNKTV